MTAPTKRGATGEFVAAMRELATSFPESNGRISGELMPYWKAPRGPQMMFITALGILQGVMLLVLLAVCGNTANLVLARASARYREVGVRLALGAGPGSVIRLDARREPAARHLRRARRHRDRVVGHRSAAIDAALRRVPGPLSDQPRCASGSPSRSSLASAAACCSAPRPRFNSDASIRSRRCEAASKSAGRSAVRDGLMALQCGLALLVLVVAGLFFQSFVETRDTDPGFRVEGLLLATYDLSGTVTNDEYPRQFATQLLDRLHRVPSVQSVALANSMPLDIHGLPLRGFTLEGRAQTTAQQEAALSNIVSPGYFKTMGIPIVAGEDFADMADRTLPPQVIVNEEFVRRYIAPADPLGRQLTNGDADLHDRRRGEELDLRRVRRAADAGVLLLVARSPALAWRDSPARAGRDPKRCSPRKCSAPFARSTRRCRSTTSGRWPSTSSATCSCGRSRRACSLVIAPLLLALVAIGIYAVVSYTVSQRTTEIGVRIAMGATADRVVKQIVKEGLIVASAGVILAWVIAAMVQTAPVQRRARSVDCVDGACRWCCSAVAAFSCWLPARRATMVDPVVALRAE